MPLSHRHGTRIKPDVDQFRHTVHLATTIGAFKGDLIHIRAVQIRIAQVAAGSFRQIFDGANTYLRMAVFTFPNR
ncbi:hypothetical protein SDC9_117003 [bioreactor metagenome]|uniref:Uncharacterized protein n=1 Tax=bioreactor metagenome TaxID=1076179 RepID=A0A645BXL1_9ZZZZ